VFSRAEAEFETDQLSRAPRPPLVTGKTENEFDTANTMPRQRGRDAACLGSVDREQCRPAAGGSAW
jgi:hypothetical protein